MDVCCMRKSQMQGQPTGGALFKVQHIALDEEVLALREAKEQGKVDEIDQVVKEMQSRSSQSEQRNMNM
jgi:hypothetical protein